MVERFGRFIGSLGYCDSPTDFEVDCLMDVGRVSGSLALAEVLRKVA